MKTGKISAEYDARPEAFIVLNPSKYQGIHNINEADLEQANLLAKPVPDLVITQCEEFREALTSFGVPLIEMGDLVGDDEIYQTEANRGINPLFTRDSATTIPWVPFGFIPASMNFHDRRHEDRLMAISLEKLGMDALINFDKESGEWIEGGDVLPTLHGGQRTLMVGLGERTTLAAAQKIADQLAPEYFDQVIALEHDPEILHLDTGYIELPNDTILSAEGMFTAASILRAGKASEDVDPYVYLKGLKQEIVYVERQDAIDNERCNMVPAGDGNFVSFALPKELRKELVDKAGINICELVGTEIAKLTGGAHCMTRPVYAPNASATAAAVAA